jgi:PPOX class probable F420-dependent enzyme
MPRAMTEAEREAFLAEPNVGVLGVARLDGRGPLLVPMWFSYRPGGEVGFLTPRDSRKARLILQAGRFSLCVQSPTLPYRYVSVEGPITAVQDPVTAAERRLLAQRYLGEADGDAYVEDTADATARMIGVRMRPERWLSEDQGERPR